MCELFSHNGFTHKACYTTKSIPDQFITMYEYKKLPRSIIIKSKHSSNNYRLLDSLTNTVDFKNTLSLINYNIDYIIPIPSSHNFFNTRFIEPADYISKKVALLLNKPILNIIKAHNFSIKSKTLNKMDRFTNIKNVLYIDNNIKLISKVKDRNVLIVDDVLTTGATMIYSSFLIKNLGVKNVVCFTLAKDYKTLTSPN